MAHHLVAGVAARVVVRTLLQEDWLDARLEKIIIKLGRLRVSTRGRLRRHGRSKRVEQDGSRDNEPSRDNLWQNSRNHIHLTAQGLRDIGQSKLPDMTESLLQGNTNVLIRSGISPTGMRVISFIVSVSMADTDLVPQVES